uniref:Cytochrome c oxidase subunit 3 n=1 Tax=Saron marmoratus TaxID=1055079 RepID=A0A7G7WQG7_9EUCA|nr:cytochrome c oxidase subunit III [Saron marmoratus]QNH68794.1 cytochrome c oxidase subunit III [Saron marmoratus]
MATLSHHHPYNMLNRSPWPFRVSYSLPGVAIGLEIWFQRGPTYMLQAGLSLTVFLLFLWWRDIVRESTYMGRHTKKITETVKCGMVLFIASEVLFFFSFFWAFFHSSLTPAVELGNCWPPAGIEPFNPFQIPLLNTAILLSSGATVTWAHHAMLESNHTQATQSLTITVLLGLYFTALQAFEYFEAPFSIADSVYGSTFFVATGFHGAHVIIGTTFLLVGLVRLIMHHFSAEHHLGFEMAAWYWHFVDVVWLFLYISIYWWGS